MGDPNQTADIFDVKVQFIPALAAGRFGFGNPTVVSEFAATASFPGRIKEYTGTISQKRAALLADGFTTSSDAYRMADLVNLQDGPPRTIYVGRKDVGDADWGVAISEIRDEATLEGFPFYAFTCSTRSGLDIEAIADYLEGIPGEEVYAFYLAQTDELAVINNTAGNVAANILAKDYKRIALLWHDPETASGFGPAILQSAVGAFNVANAATVQLQVDGGATQVFTFDSAAATLLGSQTETFAVADGDTLIVALDSGSAQTVTFDTSAATVLCDALETYDFDNGLTLSVRVDGGAAQPVIFNGTAGSVDTAAEPYAFLLADTITFSIDGGANQILTPGVGATTAALLKAEIDAQITGVTTTIIAGPAVQIVSDRLGTSSDVEIVAASANALTESGLIVGNNLGTGFAAFLDVATAAEVAAEINADTTGCTAVAEAGKVRISSDLSGTSSRIQVAGGTANLLLLFDTNEQSGSGDFVNAALATAIEVVNKINTSLPGGIASVDATRVRLTSPSRGTGSVVDVSASTMATTLGLSTVAVQGTGDFFNAVAATSAEVALKISATLTGAVASSAGSRVKITSATSGAASTVKAVGGSLLGTLLFTSASTGTSNTATGTGVQEDFADCAWMGRCITFDLDATDGAALWNNHTLKGPSPSGAGTVPIKGDRNITKTQRETLHDTLHVNTYEPRNGRNETHFGTLLNNQLGAGGFIDVRTTIDWFQARISEEFHAIDNALADGKAKLPYLQPGINVYAQGLEKVCERGGNNGHTVFDDSPLDLNNPLDTGIFIPGLAQQSQAGINARRIDGFRAQQLIQGGIQRASVILNLIGPTAE